MVIKVLRVVAYNVLFTFVGLILIALVGEGYLRLTMPFLKTNATPHFVQGVGYLRAPNSEVRYTNGLDFWTISRTNSLGFLDHEPINPQRAAESCHIAMIGDSVVEAREVPIADKFHVRLEELAARHLPHLDITTAAYGAKQHRTDQSTAVLRRICTAFVSQAHRARFCSQRLRGQLPGTGCMGEAGTCILRLSPRKEGRMEP